ncbi:MAG: glutamine synthetase III, partial [Butyrivibrio sp.]|nr:glutamine synthetase III [Butyrivibrio sp.]
MDVSVEMLGKRAFSEAIMRERLPKAVFKQLKKTLDYGAPLDVEIADSVAIAMREWAKELGATHYTHWFQPLTNLTAEKHDSFMDPVGDGTFITEFTGKELIKAEPDGSSFPTGGVRNTCSARGYTVWDCTSPAFVKDIPNGCKVLCIPTIFISYTGESLDFKTPLLRSMEAVSNQAKRILTLFGKEDIDRINASVGAEQEYFLIEKSLYERRLDLKLTGRTLYGAPGPKGQEMEDQYFSVVKDKVSHFMNELNQDLWALGIPAKTQHNEAAPAQHEIAPIFETTNIACDQNQLVMDTLKRVAARTGFACLLHEKPFRGVNGSGKHNNWSLS